MGGVTLSPQISRQTGILVIVERHPHRPMPQLQLLPGSISAILADTAATKTLTEGDRYGLLAAILDETIEDDERRAVDRILRSVHRGRVSIA